MKILNLYYYIYTHVVMMMMMMMMVVVVVVVVMTDVNTSWFIYFFCILYLFHLIFFPIFPIFTCSHPFLFLLSSLLYLPLVSFCLFCFLISIIVSLFLTCFSPGQRWHLFSLAEVMARLGHTTSTIDYLKLDIGGSEWQVSNEGGRSRSLPSDTPITSIKSYVLPT